MDEIKDQNVDPTQGQDSQKGDESNSTTPQTITLEKHRKAIEDAIAQYGDKVKREKLDPIIAERDTFKSQAEQAKREAQEATDILKESRQHISNLESDIETLEQNDDDPNKVLRLRRELRDAKTNVRQEVKDERDALQTEKDALAELKKISEAERLEWAETVADARIFKFDGDLARLVDEYEGDTTANFNKLKTACDKAGIKTKEGAEAIADLYMVKKAEEPDFINDPGVTTGGGSGIPRTMEQFRTWVDTLSAAEYKKRKPEIDKALAEGKIK